MDIGSASNRLVWRIREQYIVAPHSQTAGVFADPPILPSMSKTGHLYALKLFAENKREREREHQR
jgi:hypothetical protein